MDKPRGKLRLLESQSFLSYVKGLPTREHRTLLVPGDRPEHDRHLTVIREGDGPLEVEP